METNRDISTLEEQGTLLSTTTINTFELYYGAYRTKNPEQNIEATRTPLDRMFIHDLDNKSS